MRDIDKFAMAAMQGLLSNPRWLKATENSAAQRHKYLGEVVVCEAYEIAEYMYEESQKRNHRGELRDE